MTRTRQLRGVCFFLFFIPPDTTGTPGWCWLAGWRAGCYPGKVVVLSASAANPSQLMESVLARGALLGRVTASPARLCSYQCHPVSVSPRLASRSPTPQFLPSYPNHDGYESKSEWGCLSEWSLRNGLGCVLRTSQRNSRCVVLGSAPLPTNKYYPLEQIPTRVDQVLTS